MRRVDPADLTPDDLDSLVEGLDQLINPDVPRPHQEIAA